jgi:hypothetical protein
MAPPRTLATTRCWPPAPTPARCSRTRQPTGRANTAGGAAASSTSWPPGCADHRRHAVVELSIRDLKAGVGLRHCPSGGFAANAAWLVAATLAHNLLRWVAAIGLGARGELVAAKTLRRTLLALPGRIIRSTRRLVLHLPAGWPWAAWFEPALARLRCIAYAI